VVDVVNVEDKVSGERWKEGARMGHDILGGLRTIERTRGGSRERES
jgi:hypothetical protein